MKHKLLRLLVLTLIVFMGLQIGAMAAGYPTGGYTFPDNWSRNALIFAVQNGIFVGDQDKDLHPDANMTRAEMASVLTRLLRLREQADLSAFQDMRPGAWYYDEFAKAVAAGIFAGTSDTAMSPNAPITREQAMTVLCRAFRLIGNDPNAYSHYTDSGAVSAFARESVSTMQELRIVNGFTDGSLQPKSNITRAQVAQLLYEMLDAIVDDPSQIPASGFVLYRGDALPDSLTLDGTLVLVTPVSGDVQLNDYHVSGDLILRCGGAGQISLSGLSAANLVLGVRDSGVIVQDEIPGLRVWGDNLAVSANARDLLVQDGENLALTGQFADIRVRGGSMRFDGADATQTLTISGPAAVEWNGNAQQVLLYGKKVVLTGGGYAELVRNYSSKPKIKIAYGTYDEQRNYGLEDVKLTISNPGALSKVSQKVTLTATVSGGIYEGIGLEEGNKRTCQLIWYCNGKEIQRRTVVMYEGMEPVQDSYSKTYQLKTSKLLHDEYTVELVYEEFSLTAARTVAPNAYWTDYQNATTRVVTADVPVTINKNCKLYFDRAATRVRRSLAAGMTVYNEYNPGGVIQITCPDTGEVGWTQLSNINYEWVRVTFGDYDYSVGTKEGFVNNRGYTSDTKYLVWISKRTQRVNVYEGSADNWKLVRTSQCSTGGNYTPTPKGVFSIYAHNLRWNYDDFYVKNATVFNGNHAFHSTPLKFDGTDYDARVGTPLSHGCVRLPVAFSEYIYSLPMGTRVVVY